VYIHDNDAGDDHPHYAPWEDQLALGPEEILACANTHDRTMFINFLSDFKADYPAVVRDYCETMANRTPAGAISDDSRPCRSAHKQACREA